MDKSIQYTLKQGVPPDKIVLGLPFFGRYWIEGESYGGKGISNSRVEELVKKYNGTVNYDETAKSPEAIFTVSPDDPVTTISGKPLKPGTYHIWFENNVSLERKMDLVHKYDLKGTGSWSLGQEDPSLWNNFDSYIKNHDYQLQAPKPVPENPKTDLPDYKEAVPPTQFKDINKHWARHDINEVSKRGWMKGVQTDVFAPDKSLTRAEAAAILVRALNLKPIQTITSDTEPFGDVENNYWAKNDIIIANQHGLMKGRDKGRFAPGEKVTREEMAAILDRIIGVSASHVGEVKNFRDVKKGHWSHGAIQNMSKQGVFGGFADQTFRPTEKMTRGQMASILNRIAPRIEKEKDNNILLKAGANGLEVKSLQSDLAFLGYFQEGETGFFGKVTENAVRAFQQDHGLVVDGVAGPDTLTKIKEEIDKKNQI